jgi:rubrerythrin
MVEAEFPECTTFGSVIRFALELEKVAVATYDDLAAKPALAPAAESFKALSQAHRKRSDVLEHTRREKLNEMILEPIQDLDGKKYVVETQVPDGVDLADAKAFAAKMEDTSSRFYLDSSKIAKYLMAEAARILERMGKESQANKAKVEAL